MTNTKADDLISEICSGSISISGALLKAYSFPKKLLKTETRDWMRRELNGYSSEDIKNGHLPNYRFPFGSLIGRHPRYPDLPIRFEDSPDIDPNNKQDLLEIFSKRPIALGIEEIESLIKISSETIEMSLAAEVVKVLVGTIQPRLVRQYGNSAAEELLKDFTPIVVYSKNQFISILSNVKTNLLDELQEALSPSGMDSAERLKEAQKSQDLETIYDAFISHASEDKSTVARPLYSALKNAGLKVWFDEATLKIGSKLGSKIDEGLAKSRFGIVILSADFFKKNWTKHELDGLVYKQNSDGKDLILPIWHNVSKQEVSDFSLTLASTVAGTTSEGIEKLAAKLLEVILDREPVEIEDEVSSAKKTILVQARSFENKIYKVDNGGTGHRIQIGGHKYNENEDQRKLYLFALDELIKEGFVHHVTGYLYELTYPGLQKAQKL